jgi:hypothetical protein
MKTCFNQLFPFYPTAYAIGFIKGDPEDVSQDIFRWRAKLGWKVKLIRPARQGLAAGVELLQPLNLARSRELVIGTTGGKWSAYLANGIWGADPFPVCSTLAGVYGHESVAVNYIPRSIDASNGLGYYFPGGLQIHLGVYDPDSSSHRNCRRSLWLNSSRGRSRFDHYGTVLPFEEPSNYDAKRIRDRFNPDILNSYLNKMGIEYFNPEFYAGPNFLIHNTEWDESTIENVGLDDVRRAISIG